MKSRKPRPVRPDDAQEDTSVRTVPLRKAFRPETHRVPSLVVVYVPLDNPAGSAELGRRVQVLGSVNIGRSDASDLVLDQPEVSRRHAEVYVREGRAWVTDCGSRNGTFVNDVEVGDGVVALQDGDRITAGSCILKFIESDAENQFHEIIYRLNVEDALTRASNRRFLMEFLEREVARASRHRSPLSLVMYDLDRFKDVNDRFGHPAGDMVLRETATLVRAFVRREECFARFGGEEFCVVQPEIPLASASAVAEKMRRAVEGAQLFWDGERVAVTISCGVAELAPGCRDATELIRQADERLYKAKHGGRNRVCAE